MTKDNRQQPPTGEQHNTLQSYTDAELLAEVKRRGFDVSKWDNLPPFASTNEVWKDNGQWDK